MLLLKPPININPTAIELPASKSISNRLLILKQYHPELKINNLSDSRDTLLLKKLISEDKSVMYCENAGTVARFLLAYYAASYGEERIITGLPRLLERPVAPLVQALQSAGADITYLNKEGQLPVRVEGKQLQGGNLAIATGQSSQFASALLLASPLFQQPFRIALRGEAVSAPYLYMTVDLMRQLGYAINKDDDVIEVADYTFAKEVITVEADWSSAAYWWCVLAVTAKGHYHFPHLSKNTLQPDSIVQELLASYIRTSYTDGGCTITYHNVAPPKELDIDATDYPDLVPILAATYFVLGIKQSIKGVQHLRYKESDRLGAIVGAINKIGGKASVADEDGIITLSIAAASAAVLLHKETIVLDTLGDHRLAMCYSILAAGGLKVAITNPHVHEKSYPGFWADLSHAGFQIEEVDAS